MNKTSLSIIIVNYKVEQNLYVCLESIKKHINNTKYEVIVVENDPGTNLTKELKKFPFVHYIKAEKNKGFGAGNNLGARHAKGEFLFFLNPDTKIEKGSIDSLLKLFKEETTGAVAPLLLDPKKKPYEKQGTLKMSPINVLFSLSFISKYFPNNSIANKFWLRDWNKKTLKEVDVVPGTAFIIRKELFKKLKGFDEQFFLYFEESDLCDRIKEIGYKNYISPELQVIHEWGKSTDQRSDTQEIFNESRKYYLTKHYSLIGYLTNILVTPDLGTKLKLGFALVTLLCLSLFLRAYKLDQLMQFIPDQGWFYLSARDMLLTGTIPLVGPPTSHPWIHHGPLWTYTLACFLYIFNFNPIAPAYFIAVLGTITVGLVFLTASKMFSLKVGILSAVLFATAPLIVMNSRIPYHTSPIPFLVTLLFFLTYLWIKGNKYAFPCMMFLLAVLYNHEITTFVFDIAVIIIFIYGLLMKKEWLRKTLTPKMIACSVLLFIIPMVPMIIYDTGHGYHQTVGFLVWVGYRIIKAPLGLINPKYASSGSNPSTLAEFFTYYKALIFQQGTITTAIVGVFTVMYTFSYVLKNRLRRIELPHGLLFLFLGVGLIGLFIHRVPIEADTLLVAPFILMLTSLSILWICRRKFIFALFIVGILAEGNMYLLISTDFLTQGTHSKITYTQRHEAVKKTIQLANNKPYNIVGKGNLSDFPVFLDPYRYMLWYDGHAPSASKQKTTIQIWEKANNIVVTKK